MLRLLWVAVPAILLDQISKHLAADYLSQHASLNLLPFLSLTLVHNTGAAFGFLSSASGWQNAFFISVALVACAAILYALRRLRPSDAWMAVALALILGGAVGNVIDRATYGYVIDFIDVYYKTWHWPAFNVADSCITAGAAMLVWDALGIRSRRPSAN
jgi:signal peptidase II